MTSSIATDVALGPAILSYWDLPDLLLAARDRYPRIVKLSIHGEEYYFLTHPETIRMVMQTNGRNTEKDFKPSDVVLLGQSLASTSGAEHLATRRIAQPYFHQRRVDTYVGTIAESVTSHSRDWSDGMVIDVWNEMRALSLSTFLSTMCNTQMPGMLDKVRAYYRSLRPSNLLPGELTDELQEPLLETVAALIESHRESPEVNDVVQALLRAADADSGLTDEMIEDELRGFLIAASEPPAAATAWFWYAVSTFPGVRERLDEELDSKLKEGSPTIEDLQDLHYLNAVFAETLRLFPPSWRLERRLTVDIDIDGEQIPAGSKVIVSQLVTQRDPRFWDKPDEFLPERWLDDNGAFDQLNPGQPKGAWFPFGFGNRRCIGEHLAWLHAQVLIVEFARRWRIELASEDEVSISTRATFRPRGQLPMILRKR